MSPIKAFWAEPTGVMRQQLRRFVSSDVKCDKGEHGYHQAWVEIENAQVEYYESDGRKYEKSPKEVPHDDPRWPKSCPCGREFVDTDTWQVFGDAVYAGGSTEFTLRKPVAGAMWDAWWMPYSRGDDGICLVVVLPTLHTWMVDSRASNCTMPTDDIHRCWVRHGDVKSGNVHVDKSGNTCAAGGGSILVPGYHGFLHNGYLTDC